MPILQNRILNAFWDVWMKISKALSAYSNIYGYEIMCEPHDMGACNWLTTAQETIQSIRQVETKKQLLFRAIILPQQKNGYNTILSFA